MKDCQRSRTKKFSKKLFILASAFHPLKKNQFKPNDNVFDRSAHIFCNHFDPELINCATISNSNEFF